MLAMDVIKRYAPRRVRLLSRKVKAKIRQARDERLSVAEVFTRIYQANEWNGPGGQDFYSGPGSVSEIVQPYAAAIRAFIERNAIRSVLDIGCGDFRAGREIAASGVRYIGVDVVESLVARNQRLYGSETVTFMAKDAIEDELPAADLCLLREVLQHLSNKQIQRILWKTRKYRYVIVTNRDPLAGTWTTPNRDKPHGLHVRDGSALVLDQPPFNVRNINLFLEVPFPRTELDREWVPEGEKTGVLRSFLINNDLAHPEGS